MATIYKHIHNELAVQAGEGDQSAQFKLYELYHQAMYTTAVRMVKDEMLAEELMQDGFMSAFTKMHQWHQKSSFGAWLKRIVINECLDYMARKKLDVVHLEDEQIVDQAEETESDYTGVDMDDIKRAMMDLSSGYRTILSLYLFEGYDHEEISEILDITSSTSRSQYLRAKKKLVENINRKAYVG